MPNDDTTRQHRRPTQPCQMPDRQCAWDDEKHALLKEMRLIRGDINKLLQRDAVDAVEISRLKTLPADLSAIQAQIATMQAQVEIVGKVVWLCVGAAVTGLVTGVIALIFNLATTGIAP